MARRGRKRAVTESPLKPKTDLEAVPSENGAAQFVERQRAFSNREGINSIYFIVIDVKNSSH